jgi:hypothetical protein
LPGSRWDYFDTMEAFREDDRTRIKNLILTQGSQGLKAPSKTEFNPSKTDLNA